MNIPRNHVLLTQLTMFRYAHVRPFLEPFWVKSEEGGRNHMVAMFPISRSVYTNQTNSSMDKVTRDAMCVQGFRQTEHVWQLKRPPVAHLVLNW